VARLSRYDLSDCLAFARKVWYVLSATEDDPIMQQKGLVTVGDYRGSWMSSPLQLVQHLSAYPFHAIPIHMSSLHALYTNVFKYDIVRIIRLASPEEIRMRNRLHHGSPIEIDYALRSFGIDLSTQLLRESFSSTDNLSDHDEDIEDDIRQRQRLDDEWRQSEAPYRDPRSPIALVPNPQDVILGRNKNIASTWPRNIMYNKLVKDRVDRYIEAQTLSSGRIDKTFIYCRKSLTPVSCLEMRPTGLQLMTQKLK